MVSRRRILANSYAKYDELLNIMIVSCLPFFINDIENNILTITILKKQAPSEHWIHVEGEFWKYHGDPGPSNPYLGHAVERAWPLIFQCDDRVDLADKCGDKSIENFECQCFDDDSSTVTPSPLLPRMNKAIYL